MIMAEIAICDSILIDLQRFCNLDLKYSMFLFLDVQALGVCFRQKPLTRIVFCFVLGFFLCIFVLIVVSFLMEVFLT